MYVTDPEDLKAIAEHRWDKQHLTTSRRWRIAIGCVCWVVIMVVLSSHDSFAFGALALLAVGYLIGWRWYKRRNAEIDIILERLIREG